MAPSRSEPQPGADWPAAIRLLDDDLGRRDRAERTRRAYRSDLARAGALGRRGGALPARHRPPRGASLRRPSVTQRVGPEHLGTQAGGRAGAVQRPARARAHRAEPRRARLDPAAWTPPAAGAQQPRDRTPARRDPRREPAGAARPGDVRARLLVRAAGGGAGVDRRRRPGLRRRAGAGRGQGPQDPARAGRRAGSEGHHGLPGAWASTARRARRHPRARARCS